MARIHLDGVGHTYGDGIYALEKADLVFEDGKTYALLGPSGCGKTTMLNIISGLLFPSDGRVLLGDRDVTRVPTAERNIAQVFQFPVIYQSKTVYGNLAFPLKCRNWERKRIDARVRAVADLLGLTDRLGQSARNLTADEKQLVSMGRGLVRDDVAALLMDEPLTVIDPQMKFDLRRRIKQANRQTSHTVIYVTHDQNEAMTFADEILVMKAGRVVQRGTPKDLFERPVDTYVGNFIGSPGMNFIPVAVQNGSAMIGDAVVLDGLAGESENVAIGIRPEHLIFARPGDRAVRGIVEAVQDQGGLRVVDVKLATGRVKVKLPRSAGIPSDELALHLAPQHSRVYRNGQLAVH